MEKSIESIWKEGFLKSDALVAPKLNDLYNQKSKNIVDKFKRLFRINLIALIAFAFIILAMSFIVNIPYMGIPMFLILIATVIINRKFNISLRKIDSSQDSYQYLSSFDRWIKEMVVVNIKLNRFLYPYVFISVIAGFWFGSIGGNIPGEEAINSLLLEFPNTYLIFGIPAIGILAVILIMGILAYSGGRIYKWDLNIVYGRILKKLDEMLADMEELRS